MATATIVAPKLDKDLEAGESTPLIQKNALQEQANRQASINADSKPLGEMKENAYKETAVMGAAMATFGTSVASMMLESHPIVYLSGLVGVGVAPYAAIQEKKITECEALKEVNQHLETELNVLKVENERLQTSVGELEGSVTNLKDLQETLEEIKHTEGQSLDMLEEQLVQSRKILATMDENLKGAVLQNLITTVLACDNDGDSMINDDELAVLMLKIESQNGVELNEEEFKKKIVKGGRSLNAIMDLVRNLLSEDVPEEERIFNLVGIEGM